MSFIPLRADEVIDPRLILLRPNRGDATPHASVKARDVHPPGCRTADAKNTDIAKALCRPPVLHSSALIFPSTAAFAVFRDGMGTMRIMGGMGVMLAVVCSG